MAGVKGRSGRTKGVPNGLSIYERLMMRVEITDTCWLWRGDVEVYGRLAGVWVHRAMYEACIGPIPDGMEIDHNCRVTICVNPEHLEVVTKAENRKRQIQFEDSNGGKLARLARTVHRIEQCPDCDFMSNPGNVAQHQKRRH